MMKALTLTSAVKLDLFRYYNGFMMDAPYEFELFVRMPDLYQVLPRSFSGKWVLGTSI